jgi:hypothetical protein
MAAALGNAPNITYADESNAWAIGSSLDVVRAKLEEIAAQFVVGRRATVLQSTP